MATVAAHLDFKASEKQKILETFDIKDRLDFLLILWSLKLIFLQVEKKIRGRVKKQMEKSQREYYLNEQVKASKRIGEQMTRS